MYLRVLLSAAVCFFSSVMGDQSPITLDQAIQLTLEQSPILKAAQVQLEMRLADAWQMGLRPNPIFSYDLDDFGGTGPYKGLSGRSESYSISQLFELGGKRSARENVALAAVCGAYWDFQITKENIISKVKEAYIHAAIAKEQLEKAKKLAESSQEAFDCTSAKVSSGKTTPLMLKKSKYSHISCHLTNAKAEQEWKAASKYLKSLWGDLFSCAIDVTYPLYEVAPPPTLENCESLLENNPELMKARMNVYIARQEHELEKTRRMPDVELEAAYTQDYGPTNHYFTVGVAFPIPLFDRNQGNICRSSWRTVQADYEQQELATELIARLCDAHERCLQSYEAVSMLSKQLLPMAEEALKDVSNGYHEGQFELSDVLSAQTDWLDAHKQYLDLLNDYHTKRIEIERIAPDHH